MWGAQSTEHILTGISKVDAPLQRLDFTISHHTDTTTCSLDNKSVKLHVTATADLFFIYTYLCMYVCMY